MHITILKVSHRLSVVMNVILLFRFMYYDIIGSGDHPDGCQVAHQSKAGKYVEVHTVLYVGKLVSEPTSASL